MTIEEHNKYVRHTAVLNLCRYERIRGKEEVRVLADFTEATVVHD